MLKDRINQLDQEFLGIYHKYLDEHDKLSKFTEVTDENQTEVNCILKNIHTFFNEMMPYIHYVQERNEPAKIIFNKYADFIQNLKDNGATLVEEEQKEVIN